MNFKRIYVEITNRCNLSCSFCSKDQLPIRSMTENEFKHVCEEIKGYTEEIYLHVKGEPLMHESLESFLKIAKDHNLKVNITTNGFLLGRLESLKDNLINRMNISLNSNYFLEDKPFQNYMKVVLDYVSTHPQMVFNLRLWANSPVNKQSNERVIAYLESYFNLVIDKSQTRFKLKDRVILTQEEEFAWPSLDLPISPYSTCQGGKTHLAILASGEVSICCLDSKGLSDLGNIYTIPFREILSSKRYQMAVKEFKKNKPYLEICQHCSYRTRFKGE